MPTAKMRSPLSPQKIPVQRRKRTSTLRILIAHPHPQRREIYYTKSRHITRTNTPHPRQRQRRLHRSIQTRRQTQTRTRVRSQIVPVTNHAGTMRLKRVKTQHQQLQQCLARRQVGVQRLGGERRVNAPRAVLKNLVRARVQRPQAHRRNSDTPRNSLKINRRPAMLGADLKRRRYRRRTQLVRGKTRSPGSRLSCRLPGRLFRRRFRRPFGRVASRLFRRRFCRPFPSRLCRRLFCRLFRHLSCRPFRRIFRRRFCSPLRQPLSRLFCSGILP